MKFLEMILKNLPFFRSFLGDIASLVPYSGPEYGKYCSQKVQTQAEWNGKASPEGVLGSFDLLGSVLRAPSALAGDPDFLSTYMVAHNYLLMPEGLYIHMVYIHTHKTKEFFEVTYSDPEMSISPFSLGNLCCPPGLHSRARVSLLGSL